MARTQLKIPIKRSHFASDALAKAGNTIDGRWTYNEGDDYLNIRKTGAVYRNISPSVMFLPNTEKTIIAEVESDRDFNVRGTGDERVLFFCDNDEEWVAINTVAPKTYQSVTWDGKGLHISSDQSIARCVIGGDDSGHLDFFDYQGAANSRIMEINADGSNMVFLSLNDNLTTKIDDILNLDGSTGYVGINRNDQSYYVDVKTTGLNHMRLENNNADASPATLVFFKNTVSPGVGDRIGSIEFIGKDDAANNTTYSEIQTVSRNVTNGSEYAGINFNTFYGATGLTNATIAINPSGWDVDHHGNSIMTMFGSVANTSLTCDPSNFYIANNLIYDVTDSRWEYEKGAAGRAAMYAAITGAHYFYGNTTPAAAGTEFSLSTNLLLYMSEYGMHYSRSTTSTVKSWLDSKTAISVNANASDAYCALGSEGNGLNLVLNGYYGAFTTRWDYANSTYAQRLFLNNYTFYFYEAASGTAGNEITWAQQALIDRGGMHITPTVTGGATANTDILELWNNANAASMTNTRSSILFQQYYYDAVTPAVADLARITAGTETNWISDGGTQDGYLAFHTANNGSVAERVRITSDGYVGIREITPENVLHVEADVSGGGIVIRNGANSIAQIVRNAATNDAVLNMNSGGVPTITLNANGESDFNGGNVKISQNLGIGVSPSFGLHVTGGVALNGTQSFSAGIFIRQASASSIAMHTGSSELLISNNDNTDNIATFYDNGDMRVWNKLGIGMDATDLLEINFPTNTLALSDVISGSSLGNYWGYMEVVVDSGGTPATKRIGIYDPPV